MGSCCTCQLNAKSRPSTSIAPYVVLETSSRFYFDGSASKKQAINEEPLSSKSKLEQSKLIAGGSTPIVTFNADKDEFVDATHINFSSGSLSFDDDEFKGYGGGLVFASTSFGSLFVRKYSSTYDNPLLDNEETSGLVDWIAKNNSLPKSMSDKSVSFSKHISIVADLFVEQEEELKDNECNGVMPWDLCWLRGDDGNVVTDYVETMTIAESLLSPKLEKAEDSRTPKILRAPQISSKEMRMLKRKLVDAYIMAIPSSRRHLTMVTIAVDTIWKEVTEMKRGRLRLLDRKYKKELAWLRARKKKEDTDDEEASPRLSRFELSMRKAKLDLRDLTGVYSPIASS